MGKRSLGPAWRLHSYLVVDNFSRIVRLFSDFRRPAAESEELSANANHKKNYPNKRQPTPGESGALIRRALLEGCRKY